MPYSLNTGIICGTRMKWILNKWQIVFSIQRRIEYARGHYYILVGIFNIQQYPPAGIKLTQCRQFYKGFLYEINLYNKNKYLKLKIK